MDKQQIKDIKKIIIFWQKLFSILKDWDIKFDWTGTQTCKCIYDAERRHAIICKCLIYDDKVLNQYEYIFHEIQHICFQEIFRKESKNKLKQSEIIRQKEEQYIKDLSGILFNLTNHNFK